MEKTTLKQVREILDAAIGGANPGHGRFWNRPLADLLRMEVYEQRVIAEPGPNRGARSALIKALKGDDPFNGRLFPRMPPPPKVPVSDDKIAIIEKWINDGCNE